MQEDVTMRDYRCPVCRKVVKVRQQVSDEARFFPFCCERCKLVDLGAWLDGDYKIISPAPSHESADLEDRAQGG